MMRDYYQVLEIDKTATQHEVKKAYRNLALKYHPDRVWEEKKEEAEKKFKEIVEAYYVLSHKERRRYYDRHGVDFSSAFSSSSESYEGSAQSFDIETLFQKIFKDYYENYNRFSQGQWDCFKFTENLKIDFRLGVIGRLVALCLCVSNLLMTFREENGMLDLRYVFLMLGAGYTVSLRTDTNDSLLDEPVFIMVCWVFLLIRFIKPEFF